MTAEKIQLYHPICHLCKGERLFYISLNIQKKVNDSKREILNKIEKSKLQDSSCAYFVFGESDVIIRTWASERALEKLVSELQEIDSYKSHSVYLIDKTSTWYEREIESRGKNEFLTTEEDAEDLLHHNSPREQLTHKPADNHEMNRTRFIMFIELPYVQTNNLFEKLVTKIHDPENVVYKSVNKLSIYSYYTPKNRGVILKGETPEGNNKAFSESSQDIIDISEDIKDYSARTVTYICSKKLKDESDGFSGSLIERSNDSKKKDSIYNLLISHDCRSDSIRRSGKDGEGIYIKDAFLEMCTKSYGLLFSYNKYWYTNIKKVRDTFKWTIKKKDEPLVSSIIKEYISIEARLRTLLSKSFLNLVTEKDQAKRLSDSKKVAGKLKNQFTFNEEKYQIQAKTQKEQKSLILDYRTIEMILENQNKIDGRTPDELERAITFGTIPHLLGILVSKYKIAKETKEHLIISKLISLLNECSKNRNDLMHGNIFTICKVEDGEYLWKQFLPHYIEIVFLFPVYHEALKDLIDVLEKVEQP